MDAFLSIFSAIVGGSIAGFFSLKAIDKSFKNQIKTSEENEKRLTVSLIQAIHDEIETVWERYQEVMGSHIEVLKDGMPVLYYYPVTSDFFTVYNGNSLLIGRIADNDLRKQIIKTYTLAKGLIDSFRMNNELVHKYEVANKIFSETGTKVHEQHALSQYTSLIDYAKPLRISHANLKQEVSILLRALRKNGVLNENK